ncbi:MAG: GNAT family N-acetyltransferase [Planctomycetes bacterium]|nr:GNAT family N-acetyltransferase [Planctomycetota bacterium]
MQFVIRAAGPGDGAHIARFIRELARFEKLEHQLDVDAARLEQQLAAPVPVFSSLLAEVDGAPVGFALFFVSYSTFRTRPCLWLEDLFVLPEHRGHGAGLALLRAVATEAVRRGCPRLDWCVLDWNERAIAFYRRHGARLLSDWRVCRLEGEALARAAE